MKIGKKELLKVKGLGAKAYEQLAGFIRIREGKSTFDNTGIHPESYAIASELEKLQELSDHTVLSPCSLDVVFILVD